MRGIRNRDLRELVRKTERQGWDVRRTGRGRLAFRSPSGEVVYAASTPHGGRRSVENTRADLRRKGAEL